MAGTGTLVVEPRTIPPDLAAAAEAHGRRLGVPGALHPDDYIFWYIHDQPGQVKAEAPAAYLESGRDTAAFLKQVLAEPQLAAILSRRRPPDRSATMLEFASGYARVTRHLPAALPDLDVTACDIHAGAVEFTKGLGLSAAPSASVPEAFRLGRAYDVIFALSFFTHMPRASWGRWLDALARHLEPGGLLILTTHGEVSQGLMRIPALEDDGFFFHTASEQKDLEGAEYGNTVTSFEYVYPEVVRSGLKLVQFRQAGAGHHDLYVLHNDPDAMHYRVVDAMPSRVRALLDANRDLEAEVAALHASTSWRVTGPLRRLARVVKGR